MVDLEQQLSALATEIEWPETPDLTRRVIVHLPALRGGGHQGGRGVAPPRQRWALAAAAVILAVAALFAYSPAREAIAGWVNLHTIFQRVPNLATPSPQPSGALGASLGLGEKASLDQARRKVAWHISVPSALGPPDAVYLQQPPDAPTDGEVNLVYKARPGIDVAGETDVAVLITEARGGVDQNFFGKILGPGTTVEPVIVDGNDGWWIAGAPHEFFFTDSSGNIRSETLRLATNTLLLNDGGTVIRIEGNLTKSQALGIAASLG